MLRMRKMSMLVVATLLPLAACADQPEPLAPDANPNPLLSQSGKKVTVGDGLGVPYYASLSGSFMPTDGGWVAIVFKRSPECVPSAFNLLAWLDFSLFGPVGTACPMLVDGFWIFAHASDLGSGILPRQEHYSGNAVPVWFAPVEEFSGAIADGVLTIGELASLDGLLMGVAHIYNESIRNSDGATNGSGQRPGSSSTMAKGTLDDGRSFQVHIAEKFEDGVGTTILNVKIAFN